METKTGVSVAEYLSTVYQPDCEYVDGEVQERNVGEDPHASAETALAAYLFNRRKQFSIQVRTNIRVQVRQERFRVPDVCVIKLPRLQEPILTHPPFLCVEILSPEDRMSRTLEKVADYLSFGVPYVWVIDPRTRKAITYTFDNVQQVTDGILHTEDPDLAVPITEVLDVD